MSYSCLEELQVDLDLHNLDKTNILSKIGCQYDKGWFVVTDDGICHLFAKNGNLDNIKKIKQLTEKHIRKDITKIVIPDSVTSIGDYAFEYCSGLTSVMIPDSVTSIGYDAFYGCKGLTSITIPNSVKSIGGAAFCDCYRLMSLTIGNGVMSIGMDAFSYCNRLTNVMIPDSIMSIEHTAFYECIRLTSVMIGQGITSIEDYAFKNCWSLRNLTFKNKTLEQVKKMKGYPWGIKDESIIHVE